MENKIKAGIPLNPDDFKEHWRADDIRQALWDWHHGKCCYCERKRDKKWDSDVEHFRPKAAIAKEDGHPGYWWLAYEWENYFLACKSCNQEYKKTHFPLMPGGKRALSEEDDLGLEKPVLINPVDENPEEFIGFDWESNRTMVKTVGLDKDGRGRKTVNELTAVNKKEVMMQRADIVNRLRGIVYTIKRSEKTGDHNLKSKYCSRITEETAANKEFAGLSRAFFREAGLSEYVCKD